MGNTTPSAAQETTPPSPEPLLRTLAAFAASVSRANTPERVREQAGLCILDTFGCMLAGARAAETIAFNNAERQLNGRSQLSALSQARVLGYAGDVFELNDLVGGHASIGTLSASLINAREQGATGTQLLDAVIAGNEITSRLFEAEAWQQKPFDESGIVITSMLSAIGTAAAVARLRGFAEDQMTDAMAISGALASWGPAEVIFGNGGTIKPVQFGAGPADSAIRAAAYVAAGLTGPHNLIESPIGLMTTIAHGFSIDKIRGDGTWHLLNTQRKLHASCGFTHSAVDAMAAMARTGGKLDAARRIEIHVPEYIIPAVSKSLPPASPNEARFHLQYCVALAASGVDAILPEHSIEFERYINRVDIQHYLARTVVLPLPEVPDSPGQRYNRSKVVIIDSGGNFIEESCDAPRGSFLNPLSDDDIVNKFRKLAAGILPAANIEACIAQALTLDEQPDVAILYDALDQFFSVQSNGKQAFHPNGSKPQPACIEVTS